MTVLTNIVSAIGNNSSIYPLIVRDCGIEVPVKVYKTYKQNKSDREIAYLSTRERLIDEYSTSAVWLGGIPLIGKICDKIITKNGFSPKVSVKLLNNNKDMNYIQSLENNIKKFAEYADAGEAVKDLENVKMRSNFYKKLMAGKFFTQMIIPILLMGVIIPKTVYAITAATRRKIDALKSTNMSEAVNKTNFDDFLRKSGKDTTFRGNFSSSLCELTTLQKMAITDGGYAVGRVATARKKKGAIDLAFKMIGMLYLNFVAPKQIEKILSRLSKSIFKLDVNLDPKILADKNFVEQILNNNLKLPKSNKLEDILNFIDAPENINSLYVKYAEQTGKLKLINGKIRDPRFYAEEKPMAELRSNMKNFAEALVKQNDAGKSVNKYLKRARTAKTFNILSNVALSSYLLACVLPNVQYFLREKILKTKLEPDLV